MKNIEEVKQSIEASMENMKKKMHMIPLHESNLQDLEEEKRKILVKSGFASPVVLALITGLACGIFIGIACMIYYYA